MQEGELKRLIQVAEQAVKLLQQISSKLDKLDESVRQLVSANIKYF